MPRAAWRESIEQIDAESASIERMFGPRVGRNVSMKRRSDPAYISDLAEASRFLSSVLDGQRPLHYFHEAMSTSDFPELFGDIISRQTLATYTMWPVTWTSVAKKILVRDFRDNKLFPPMLGGDQRLDVVPEGTNYPEVGLEEQTPVTFSVKKRGRRLAFTFEAMLNDDLDLLRDIPGRLATAARRTEEREVTDQYVGAAGPHASLYTAGNANIINTSNGAAATNPPLSIAGLQDAFTVLGNQVDEEGEPIMVESVTLVVPPALEVTARNILSATELRFDTVSPGATTGLNQGLTTQNWMRGRVVLQVNPYIPIVATSNQHTTWFLFANPAMGRPAIIAAFLRGFDQPQILIREPNAITPGGGRVDPMDGDFDTDSIQYRVRHIVTAARLDGKATVASNGSGS
jgi:hypothetical protein